MRTKRKRDFRQGLC